MIKTWKHKGLKAFYETGSKKGITPSHADKLVAICDFLDQIEEEADLKTLYLGLHKLKGNLKECYAMKVSGNWRVIFQLDDTNIILVDYLDYHGD